MIGKLAFIGLFGVASLAMASGTARIRGAGTVPPAAPSALVDAPSNDECANAVIVPSVPFTAPPADITNATPQEVDEGFLHPCQEEVGADRTVWYSFTPASTGRYVITTCPARGATGSTVYDSFISIFDGT